MYATLRQSHAILLLILMTLAVPARAQDTPGVLFVNATFHTIDPANSTATAMLVGGGRILYIGPEKSLPAEYTSAPRMDLGGRHVFPAFTDAHGHLFGFAEEHTILRLHGLSSKEQAVSRVRDRAAQLKSGAWIRGRGWDQNLWADKQFPHRRDLDLAVPNHPVFLSRVDGHAAWVNSAALGAAGITRTTPDPPGGRILHDPDGEPSGLLLDNAVDLVRGRIPLPDREAVAALYRDGMRRCHALGIAGMHDMGLSAEQIDALQLLITRDDFPFRLVGYIDGRGNAWEKLLAEGRMMLGDGRLTLAGLKLYADGALGSRGALLLADYSDDPGNRGIAITNIDTIHYETVRAIRAGLQVCVHAIGDGGNRLTLDAYERALAEAGRPMHALRVEHAQVLADDDIPRFARLGIIPSMQPIHCTSDMYWAESRVGPDRVRGAYAWRALIDAGAWIPAGSDCPVEDPNPLLGIHAACTRQSPDGIPASAHDIETRFNRGGASSPRAEQYQDGWYGAQKLTRSEAIRAYTIWAARAAGVDGELGSLEEGKRADFIVLSSDISNIPAEDLLKTTVERTYVGGERVYVRAENTPR